MYFVSHLFLERVPGPAHLLQVPDQEASVLAHEGVLLRRQRLDGRQHGQSRREGRQVGRAPQRLERELAAALAVAAVLLEIEHDWI